MTISDEQLVRSVREGVAARPGAGVPLDDVLRAGRRRTARRRAVAGAVLGVAAVVAVAGSVVGLPLVTSAPPAAPSVTLSPDPTRTTALRPATDMYAVGDAAIVAAGLPLRDATARWGASTGVGIAYGVSPGALDDIVVSTNGSGYQLETAHLTVDPDPGSTACSAIVQPPMQLSCVREPQDDGSVLFELRYEGELVQYVLLHRTGFVRVTVMGPLPPEARGPEPSEPADPERLLALVLDPDLRW